MSSSMQTPPGFREDCDQCNAAGQMASCVDCTISYDFKRVSCKKHRQACAKHQRVQEAAPVVAVTTTQAPAIVHPAPTPRRSSQRVEDLMRDFIESRKGRASSYEVRAAEEQAENVTVAEEKVHRDESFLKFQSMLNELKRIPPTHRLKEKRLAIFSGAVLFARDCFLKNLSLSRATKREIRRQLLQAFGPSGKRAALKLLNKEWPYKGGGPRGPRQPKLPQELLERLKVKAMENKRTVAKEVEFRLRESLEHQGEKRS